ncbi:MAG TPA: hypothetical protein PKE12_12460 [Kiritimatiellia bacterium]|nr:hypothetical protein [Kiritimatiellia bacterium]
MNRWHRSGLGLMCVSASLAWAAESEIVSAPGGCPAIEHVPVVNVVRGTPAVITAKVVCPGGELSEVLLQVRLTDLGKPSPMAMTGDGDGIYSATVPVSMVQGLTRFWYYIDARGRDASGAPTSVETTWKPVNIVQHGNVKEGASGGIGKKAGWIAAGGAAVVAAALIVDNNSGGGSGGGGGGGDANLPPVNPAGGGGGGSSDSPAEGCTRTYLEQVSLGNTSPCSESSGIDVYVCNNCPDATISAVTSWGVVRTFQPKLPRSCGNSEPVFTLPYPEGFPEAPESETIRVFINGQLIRQFAWPGIDEYYNCL